MASKALFAPFALLLNLCDERGGHADYDADPEPSLDAGVELDCATPDAAAPRCEGPPGLYRDDHCQVLAEGVRSYRPRYPFYSDGAGKERFVYLPPGTKIDATDPDVWVFPKGTRLYKTFALEGKTLETRIIEKVGDGAGSDQWTFVAYAWTQEQTGVEPEPVDADAGRMNWLDTPHDIPTLGECHRCHERAGQDAINGFSAIQLNHEFTDLSLADLVAEGLIDTPDGEALIAEARVPGDDLDRTALGTLHTNCGICHGGTRPPQGLGLRLAVGDEAVEDTAAWATAIDEPLRNWTGRTLPVDVGDGFYETRILPGKPEKSGVIGRMSVRGRGEQMPPVAVETIDVEGRAKIAAWISRLKPGAKPPKEDDGR
ncbi:MAG: hypothetical protein ABW252_16220 [Polyangiales bacterium]